MRSSICKVNQAVSYLFVPLADYNDEQVDAVERDACEFLAAKGGFLQRRKDIF